MFQSAGTSGEIRTKNYWYGCQSEYLHQHSHTQQTRQPTTYIKFFQLKLQHSIVATDNLVKLIAEQGTDIRLLQEPYTIQNKIVGIPKWHKNFTHGKSRTRAAIVVINNQIDTLLIKYFSDSDTVVLEVTLDNARIVLACMYLDINQHIDDNLLKIEAIIQFSKGEGIILAIDSNSRSTTWHDKQTNARGRILEEFLTSNQLHILKEDSDYTTFSSTRGSRNIDLTIVNTQLLRTVK